MKFALPFAFSLAFLATAAQAADFRVVADNVESAEDTNTTQVAEDIQEIGPADIWGLQEVEDRDAVEAFRDAMDGPGRMMWYELAGEGGEDRLAIVYDRNRFDALEGPVELSFVGGSRPPLWMRLREKSTGISFNVVVTHFNRGDAALRNLQAQRMREWAALTDKPTMLLGDFNFDLEVPAWIQGRYQGNRAFRIFTREPNPFTWVEHEPKLKTQCSEEYNSVLDFVFLEDMPDWDATAELLFPDQAYCDDEATGGADHRPIVVTLTPSGQ